MGNTIYKQLHQFTDTEHECGHTIASQTTVLVDISKIEVPEYYINEIPKSRQDIYDVLGIKYVRVVTPNRTYLIHSDSLASVVKSQELYAYARI
jgi:hypothetical protein